MSFYQRVRNLKGKGIRVGMGPNDDTTGCTITPTSCASDVLRDEKTSLDAVAFVWRGDFNDPLNGAVRVIKSLNLMKVTRAKTAFERKS